jgi:hypothetical protein
MTIACPVWGFLPFCAAFSTTLKEPNPDNVTRSPFSMAFATLASTLLRTNSARTRVIPLASAIVAISSPLFINSNLFAVYKKIYKIDCIFSRYSKKNNWQNYWQFYSVFIPTLKVYNNLLFKLQILKQRI